uniref:STAS/SEC14 domain-containing protein n=1 Tax=Roseihalotalea indica TaxID=2867963 RepID=A0AA49JIP6_9BACT|nr:hypothetical protein K4G66_27735 [Tunicatimonas sp. TK19036]
MAYAAKLITPHYLVSPNLTLPDNFTSNNILSRVIQVNQHLQKNSNGKNMKVMVKTVDNLFMENAKIVYDHQINCLSVSLSGFVPYHQMESITYHELEMIQHYQIKNCLVDLRQIKVYSPGTRNLADDVWVPGVIKEGVQHLAIVLTKDVVEQLSTTNANSEIGVADDLKLQVKYFTNLNSAKEWIKNL